MKFRAFRGATDCRHQGIACEIAKHQPRAAGEEGASGSGGHGRASRSAVLNHQTATRPHWCEGRQRVRRARAGFEIGRAEPPNSDLAPLVWRAPEGPEGTGKPRTATSPARLEAAAGPAGPGRASRRRAERSSRRGRRAGGPPPTGTQSSPARRVRPDGARNTSGATSTTERRSLRTPRSTPGSGRPGGRRGGQAH